MVHARPGPSLRFEWRQNPFNVVNKDLAISDLLSAGSPHNGIYHLIKNRRIDCTHPCTCTKSTTYSAPR